MRRRLYVRLTALVCVLVITVGGSDGLLAKAGEGLSTKEWGYAKQSAEDWSGTNLTTTVRMMEDTYQGEQPDTGEVGGLVEVLSENVQSGENSGIPDVDSIGIPDTDSTGIPSERTSVPADVQFGLTARSAVLMEASTGTVIYELNGDEQLSPASITKIMTLILIFEALDSGRISLTDSVTTSAYAKSMGGSQVFLEEGEVQSVETMIKCIVIASGNDASVAMAEHLAGSETEFVRQMNEKARELGMTGTNFEDCCGLTDSSTHVTTAKDVAIMSRELITRHPEIKTYSTIWMENITHVTNKGSSEFGLANTNKLLKMTNSFKVTGLKTGSTSLAKYCLSATAEKDGVEMIAVIMAAENYKVRFSEAQTLLNYGYSNCSLYRDDDGKREVLPSLAVRNGVESEVPLKYGGDFSYLMFGKDNNGQIETQLVLEEKLQAPVQKGQKAGSLNYLLNGKIIGSVDILAAEAVEEASFWDYLGWLWAGWCLRAGV